MRNALVFATAMTAMACNSETRIGPNVPVTVNIPSAVNSRDTQIRTVAKRNSEELVMARESIEELRFRLNSKFNIINEMEASGLVKGDCADLPSYEECNKKDNELMDKILVKAGQNLKLCTDLKDDAAAECFREATEYTGLVSDEIRQRIICSNIKIENNCF